MMAIKKSKKTKEMELIFRLFLEKKEFRSWVISIRKKLKIPNEGFTKTADYFDWLNSDPVSYIALCMEANEQATRYGLPSGTMILITNYVINNLEYPIMEEWDNIPAHIVSENESKLRYTEETRLREAKLPYAKIYIYGHATQTNVVNFIKKNWEKNIVPLLHKEKIKEVRRTYYNKRDRDVLKLNEQTLEKLRYLTDDMKGYRYDIIAKLLEKEYPGITGLIVKKTIQKIKV